jgi:hypothetical protein
MINNIQRPQHTLHPAHASPVGKDDAPETSVAHLSNECEDSGDSVMKHSRYKYFSNIDHARQFMGGRVYHQTLGYFRDYEDGASKRVIGDEFESTRIYRPADGLQVNNLTQGTSFPLPMGFESSARAGEIYVFCMSLLFTDDLTSEFGACAVVEILKPGAFIKRWLAALPNRAAHFAMVAEREATEHEPRR